MSVRRSVHWSVRYAIVKIAGNNAFLQESTFQPSVLYRGSYANGEAYEVATLTRCRLVGDLDCPPISALSLERFASYDDYKLP